MIHVRALIAAVALGLAAPAAADDARPDRRAPDGRTVVLGLAALAAVALAVRESREDDEEEEREERRLPAECLVAFWTPEGPVEVYEPGCLDERFGRAGDLPLGCAVTVRSDGRFVSGFAPACLHEAGWRTD